jgi:hypothetical protein
MRIRDGNNSDPGWKKVGYGINIPDPQHWKRVNNDQPGLRTGGLQRDVVCLC